MSFQTRIPVLMALYGLRSHEVADRIGMDRGQFARILTGPYEPRPETRRRIVEAIVSADFATDTPRRSARTSQTATR